MQVCILMVILTFWYIQSYLPKSMYAMRTTTDLWSTNNKTGRICAMLCVQTLSKSINNVSQILNIRCFVAAGYIPHSNRNALQELHELISRHMTKQPEVICILACDLIKPLSCFNSSPPEESIHQIMLELIFLPVTKPSSPLFCTIRCLHTPSWLKTMRKKCKMVNGPFSFLVFSLLKAL